MSAHALAAILLLAQATSAAPSPRLIALDQELEQELQSVKAGSVGASAHADFLKDFRTRLDAAMPRNASSEDVALHSLLLSRLGARERNEALSNLDAALLKAAGDPFLLKARGRISYEAGDFASAAAAAQAVLKGNADRKEPPDPGALNLFHESNARGAAAPSPPSRASQTPQPASAPSRQPIQFTSVSKRGAVDVPPVEGESSNGESKSGLVRAKEWALDLGTRYVGAAWGAQPEEAKIVRDGVATGGAVGAGLGAVGGTTVAVPSCVPSFVMGAGYVVCVGVGAAVGTFVGTTVGGFAGGSAALGLQRGKSTYAELVGEKTENE